MSTLKVCLVTDVFPPADTGGVGEVVYNLQYNLNKLGIEAIVLTKGNVYESNATEIRIPCKKELFAVSSFNYYLKNTLDFDVLHFQAGNSSIGILPVKYIKHNKAKILTNFHVSAAEEMNAVKELNYNGTVIARPLNKEYLFKFTYSPIHFAQDLIIAKASDKIICVSEQTKKECLNDYRIPKNKVDVIHNGIDTVKFSPVLDGWDVRNKYSINNSPMILYVGRLRIRKGVYFLIYAMKEVIKKIPSVKLLIIGSGEHENNLKRLTYKLGLQGNIIFAGKILTTDFPHYYAASDLVIVPSIYEGFPLVVLEAMASGKAVIASNVSGIPEAIKHGENGMLFEVGDVEQLTRHIITLIENPSLREEMGKKGRKIAEERFDWKIVAKQYIKEYNKLI